MARTPEELYRLAAQMAASEGVKMYFGAAHSTEECLGLLKVLPEQMVDTFGLILSEEADMRHSNHEHAKRRHQVNKTRLLQRALRVVEDAKKSLPSR